MAAAVVLLAGSMAWAGGPGGGTRIEGVITAIDAEAQQLVVAGTTVQVTEQTAIKKNGRSITFADLAVGMTVAACGTVQDGVLVANQITVKQCQAVCAATAASKSTLTQQLRVVPLSPAEQEGLVFMREEEKLARDVYLTLAAQWQIPIFSNIAASEQTHMDSIRTLLVRYNVPDPVAGMGVGEFATEHFQTLYADLVTLGSQSLINALTVGATIEEIDIVDLYDRLEDLTHQDIQRVYQNLERGSENHLRAFVGQLANRGVTYEPQYLDPELYQQIIGG
jgi:hypothetical protein